MADFIESTKNKYIEDVKSSGWHKDFEKNIKEYEGLIEEYKEKNTTINMSLYHDWVRERDNIAKKLNYLEHVWSESKKLQDRCEAHITNLIGLRDKLFKKRKEFIEMTIGKNKFVRMELIQYGDSESVEHEYRNLLNLDDGKFISSIYEAETKIGVLSELINWKEYKHSSDDLPKLIANIKQATLNIAKGEITGNHKAFNNRLNIQLSAQPSSFDHLEAWWPEDALIVKYSENKDSENFKNLENGSSGQKAAAILAFLLSYGYEPFIIDQPEDDLDNALIYDLIVKQIKENKTSRQIIIVTHNPNIVVNGESDNVIVMCFENSQARIDVQGTLDYKPVIDKICTIMEGGRAAFNFRYDKLINNN
jgi:DNA repair exonuclease SbcCD ATPase subunit